MVTPKQVCDAGLAVSFAQARRMIASKEVWMNCAKCGNECQNPNEPCGGCGRIQMILSTKGNKK